jgi:hypothetical protein
MGFNTTDQLLIRFLHSSDTGEKMEVQWDSTSVWFSQGEQNVYNSLTELGVRMKPLYIVIEKLRTSQ